MSEPIRLWRRNFLRGTQPTWVDEEPKHPAYFQDFVAVRCHEFAALSARVAKLEAALRKIAAAGPSKDPCADEYDADGKRWTYAGGEATWCTYESDEASEKADHAADVAAYSLAVEARAALEDKS